MTYFTCCPRVALALELQIEALQRCTKSLAVATLEIPHCNAGADSVAVIELYVLTYVVVFSYFGFTYINIK